MHIIRFSNQNEALFFCVHLDKCQTLNQTYNVPYTEETAGSYCAGIRNNMRAYAWAAQARLGTWNTLFCSVWSEFGTLPVGF